MNNSGKGVSLRHAAPNGAWLPAWIAAINMALLTELARSVSCVSAFDVCCYPSRSSQHAQVPFAICHLPFSAAAGPRCEQSGPGRTPSSGNPAWNFSNSHFVRLVGRVTPCAPVLRCLQANSAHGVTRPTLRPIPIMRIAAGTLPTLAPGNPLRLISPCPVSRAHESFGNLSDRVA
jgi:hypothetical protein